MKKILVPTDFSKQAAYACDMAVQIAKKASARIILLHVVEQPGGLSFSIEGEMDLSKGWEERLFTMKLIEKSKSDLAELAGTIKSSGVKVTSELRLGNPFHGMRNIIAEHKVDLVVMGTSGKSRLEEMIIGSNTEKVIRQSNCPVLTVHEKPLAEGFKNVVYATSLDEDEKEFFKVIRNTQSMYDATVHLVRINTPSNFVPDHIALKHMEKFAKKVNIPKLTINIFNGSSEEEGIIHFAEAIHADLIAMATHGRKGFAHLLAGSIAEDVANHAHRPVLTYVTK